MEGFITAKIRELKDISMSTSQLCNIGFFIKYKHFMELVKHLRELKDISMSTSQLCIMFIFSLSKKFHKPDVVKTFIIKKHLHVYIVCTFSM